MPSKCQLCLVSCQELFYDSIFSRHFFKRLVLFGESFIEKTFYPFFFLTFYSFFAILMDKNDYKKQINIMYIDTATLSKVLPTKPTPCFCFQVLKVTKIHSISSFSFYVCTVKGNFNFLKSCSSDN